MEDRDRYAIGQQDFKTLREDHAYYVDKTAYVDKIARSNTKYYFLGRPRRFGKSLFLSTLKYFFEGRRELFSGLYIDSTDWSWEPYPVLHLDLNTDKFADKDVLGDVMEGMLTDWERKYGVTERVETYSQRFRNVIKKAHETTGRPVVILVDEYDKPLVSNLGKEKHFEHYRLQLASLYSNFKSCAEHIRLVFMTGVSRFSKLSVFSDLNNLNDISFDDAYADICGITEHELLTVFQDGIHGLAETYQVSYDTVVKRMKQNYDGYRFARNGSDIYNPWSVLNALKESRMGTFWNATSTASIVAKVLHRADVDIERTLNARWRLDDLAGLDLRNADPTALLYQTGYLTIAQYNLRNDSVRLKVPNKEVRRGLFNDLLKVYIKPPRGTAEGVVRNLMDAIEDGQPEAFMQNLKVYMAGIPYDLKIEDENNFHNAIYILLTLLGLDTKAEVHTSDGRIDLLIETDDFIYVIELKYDSTPEKALRQIDEKEYALKFAADPRKLFRIGASFSSSSRRIDDWLIE